MLDCTVQYHIMEYCTTCYFYSWYTPLVEVNQAIYAWSFRQKVFWVVVGGWWHCNYSYKLQVQVRLWDRLWNWDWPWDWNMTFDLDLSLSILWETKTILWIIAIQLTSSGPGQMSYFNLKVSLNFKVYLKVWPGPGACSYNCNVTTTTHHHPLNFCLKDQA